MMKNGKSLCCTLEEKRNRKVDMQTGYCSTQGIGHFECGPDSRNEVLNSQVYLKKNISNTVSILPKFVSSK